MQEVFRFRNLACVEAYCVLFFFFHFYTREIAHLDWKKNVMKTLWGKGVRTKASLDRENSIKMRCEMHCEPKYVVFQLDRASAVHTPLLP